MPTFALTDDPADPCMLCVGCDYGLDADGKPDRLAPDLWRYYLPDGSPATHIYRHLHTECADAMDRYVAENTPQPKDAP